MVAAVNFGCAFGFTTLQAVVTSSLEQGKESNGKGEKLITYPGATDSQNITALTARSPAAV